MPKYKCELIGEIYDQLTVIDFKPGAGNIRRLLICKCSCGNIIDKTDKHLKRNKTNSCGCHLNKPTKICSICKIEKDKSEFNKLKGKKIGVQSKCRVCSKEYFKTTYPEKRDHILKLAAIVRNKPERIAKNKKYYTLNKDKYKERYKKYMTDEEKVKRKELVRLKYKETNSEKIKKQKKEYSQRQEVKERKKLWHKEKQKTDINYVLKRRLRCRLRHAILSISKNKYKYKSALDLVGCDMQTLKAHIESTFTDGMNWDRIAYIDIDHIKPCILFDLTKLDEQQKCFSYKNLQALWWVDNNIKRTQYSEPST